MKLNSLKQIIVITVITTVFMSCKDGNSVFDPDYVPSEPDPVISSISPVDGYLAGVDSVIVTGENFATHKDSIIINFGGSPGVILKTSKTEMVVRPGTKAGEDIGVRVAVRGAEFFSNTYPYTLLTPFDTYFGLKSSTKPTSGIAIDGLNNIYTIVDRGGIVRYVKISPDGDITTDGVRASGEGAPTDSTMRFNSYVTIVAGSNDKLYMAQQGLRAIFQKTFGDGLREGVWAASSNGGLQIRDLVFDNNGFLWAVGSGSDQIHRFNASTKNETQFPFEGALSAVAFYANENELYVGGNIAGQQQVWKFTIDGNGNLTQGEQYFDFGEFYNGTISSMVFSSSGELLITAGTEESIIRVFPNKSHEVLYEGMLKPGAYNITWRDDEFAVVAVKNDNETSLNFLNMYDRTRAGIFGF